MSDHSTATAGASVRLTTPSVTLAGSGNIRTFTMPASDVTVHATFAKTALQLLWEQVMSLIENVTFTVPQEYASTSDALAAYLANLINQLLQGTGFTVTAGDIVVFNFTPTTTGDSVLPAGQTWRVYNLVGVLIYNGVALDAETQCIASLPSRGVYIVSDGNRVIKQDAVVTVVKKNLSYSQKAIIFAFLTVTPLILGSLFRFFRRV